MIVLLKGLGSHHKRHQVSGLHFVFKHVVSAPEDDTENGRIERKILETL